MSTSAALIFSGPFLFMGLLFTIHWWLGRLERVEKERRARAAAGTSDHSVELTAR